MITRRTGLAALAALAAAPARAADPWPTRPIRLVVPFAPGGFTDIAARIVAAQLTPRLGQSMVVENRAGAAGIIGTEAVARSEADGYTLVMGGVSTHAMNVALYRRLPYDPLRDFAAVSGVAMYTVAGVFIRSHTSRNHSHRLARSSWAGVGCDCHSPHPDR